MSSERYDRTHFLIEQLLQVVAGMEMLAWDGFMIYPGNELGTASKNSILLAPGAVVSEWAIEVKMESLNGIVLSELAIGWLSSCTRPSI